MSACDLCDGTGVVYDEEPEDIETGRIYVVMVGDDYKHAVDPEDCTPIDELAYCHVCGQIGRLCARRSRSVEGAVVSTRHQYYVPPTVEPGESISWSTLHNSPDIVTHEWREGRLIRLEYEGIPFTPISYCTFGDYDNSTAVERSNLRVLRAQFAWLVHVTGDYGSEMLGYLGRRETQNPELLEAIDALESYPVADESDESELETEMEWAAWKDWGRRDFAREFDERGILDTLDPGYEHDCRDILAPHDAERSPLLDEIWHTGADVYNINGGPGMTIESGGNVHFYIDEWFNGRNRDTGAHWVGNRERRTEIEALIKQLAISSRVLAWYVPLTNPELDTAVEVALHGIANAFA